MAQAPIHFTIRISIDRSKKIVTWMQDAVDANGLSDRQITTYGDAQYSACQIFDEENWDCELRASVSGDLLHRPEMKNGNLSRYYFGKTVNYEKHYPIFGFIF